MHGSVLYYISGFATALFILLILARKARLQRVSGEDFALELPLFGCVATYKPNDSGRIYTEDYINHRRSSSLLEAKIDLQKMMDYAIRYDVDYITTTGDRPDGSWSDGRYAFCTMSRSHKRSFAIHINPYINTEEASQRLSLQLGTWIPPEDVYPFLFLHEIGHTSGTGNRNFFAAVINHTISGDRHSLSKRRELFRLKSEIEDFADRFALQELKRWKDNPPSILPPLHGHSHI